jgi:hypothetical protein
VSKFQVIHHRRYGIGQIVSIGVNGIVARFAAGSFMVSESDLNTVRAS